MKTWNSQDFLDFEGISETKQNADINVYVYIRILLGFHGFASAGARRNLDLIHQKNLVTFGSFQN